MAFVDCMKRKANKPKEPQKKKKAKVEGEMDVDGSRLKAVVGQEGKFVKKIVTFSKCPVMTVEERDEFAKKRRTALTPAKRKSLRSSKLQSNAMQVHINEPTGVSVSQCTDKSVILASRQDQVAREFSQELGQIKQEGNVKGQDKVISQSSEELIVSQEAMSCDDNDKVISGKKHDSTPSCEIMDYTDYAEDIFRYCLSLEERFKVPQNFISCHPHITHDNRQLLIDWLIQVQVHQQLSDVTLQLCVSLIDLYLSRKPIMLERLQLLGVSCLLIASKYEDRYPPTVNQLVYLTDYSFVFNDLIYMEKSILQVMSYQVFVPTAYNFIPWLVTAALPDDWNKKKVAMISYYLLDLAASDSRFSPIRPSVKAVASIALALFLINNSNKFTDDVMDEHNVCEHNNISRRDRTTVRLSSLSTVKFSNFATVLLAKAAVCCESEAVTCTRMMASLVVTAQVSKYQGARVKFGKDCYLSVSRDVALISDQVLANISHQG